MPNPFELPCKDVEQAVERVQSMLRMTGQIDDISVSTSDGCVVMEYPGNDELMIEIISMTLHVYEEAARPFPVNAIPKMD